MEVVRDEDGPRLVEPQEVRDDAPEGVHRLGRLEVADVLREEDLAADARAPPRVFRCAPTARMTGSILGHDHGQRGIAPGAPQDAGRAGRNAHDAVVDVPLDRPVVHEEDVGQAGQTRERLALVRADRLLAQVPARRDERERRRPRSSRWWRGVAGSMSPSSGRPGATARRDGLFAEAGQQNDGRLRGLEERRGCGRDLRERSRGGEIAHHEGERLVLARLAGAQPPDGGLVPRVAHQVEAAETLAREDIRPAERRRRRPPSASSPRASTSPDPVQAASCGPAGGARRRLRVEAAVERVLVFGPALRAERESRASWCSGRS